MNDYFGALMQSSGLSVDADATSRWNTTIHDTSSTADYGIVEIDDQVSVAHNEYSVNKTMPFEPGQGRTGVASEDGPVQPGVGIAPIPSVVEESRAITIEPMVEAQAADALVGDMRSSDAATPPRSTEPSQFHSKDSLPPEPTLVQAALQWIAEGESLGQAVPESASMLSPGLDPTVVSKEVEAHVRAEDSAGNRVIEERLELSPQSSSMPPLGVQAVEASVTLHDTDTLKHRRALAHDPGGQDAIKVTIGSINVRVDAPPPPAVSVTAPSSTLRTSSESPPRSGLSRRTLWRI